MKLIIAYCCAFLVTVALARPDIDASNKYESHHTQHHQSVSAAKQSLEERLAKLKAQSGQSQYGNVYGSSGSEQYVAGCASCISHNSRHSSTSQQRSSDYGLGSSDYVGVGIVGHSTDSRFSSNNQHEDDVQSVVEPSFSGGSSSSSKFTNAYESEELQQRVVPADLSSVTASQYRATEHDEDDDVQRTVDHGFQSSRTSSQLRGSSRDISRTGSVAVPVQVQVYPASTSQISQQSRSSSSQTESESRSQNAGNQYVAISTRPVQPTYVGVPVRVVSTNGIPAEHQKYYVRTSDSSASELSNTRTSPTSTTYRVTYTPSRNSVSTDRISDSESTRYTGGVQQPEKFTAYNSFNTPDSSSQTRFQAEESDSHSQRSQTTQTRVTPVTVSYPYNGGSSRYATSSTTNSQQGSLQTRVDPGFSVNVVTTPRSVSTSRVSASEREESRNQVSYRPVFSSSATSSGSEQQSSSTNQQQGVSGSTYYIVPSRAQSQQQQQSSGSQSQYQQRQGGSAHFSPYYPASRTQTTSNQYGSTSSDRTSQRYGSESDNSQYGSSFSDRTGQRFGSDQDSQYTLSANDRLQQRFGSSVTNLNTDNLFEYMSESERLARLQQQQISGSSRNSAVSASDANRRTIQTAANLDSAAANFVHTSNLANRNSEFDGLDLASTGTGTGGYQQVRSWNKQSKWSSGSEYGSDGKPKSYSTLSTGEAEKYNINGAETGYKAATTTLENDGKVSTYSMHTP